MARKYSQKKNKNVVRMSPVYNGNNLKEIFLFLYSDSKGYVSDCKTYDEESGKTKIMYQLDIITPQCLYHTLVDSIEINIGERLVEYDFFGYGRYEAIKIK